MRLMLVNCVWPAVVSPLAQFGVHSHGMLRVSGSIPGCGHTFFTNIPFQNFCRVTCISYRCFWSFCFTWKNISDHFVCHSRLTISCQFAPILVWPYLDFFSFSNLTFCNHFLSYIETDNLWSFCSLEQTDHLCSICFLYKTNNLR